MWRRLPDERPKKGKKGQERGRLTKRNLLKGRAETRPGGPDLFFGLRGRKTGWKGEKELRARKGALSTFTSGSSCRWQNREAPKFGEEEKDPCTDECKMTLCDGRKACSLVLPAAYRNRKLYKDHEDKGNQGGKKKDRKREGNLGEKRKSPESATRSASMGGGGGNGRRPVALHEAFPRSTKMKQRCVKERGGGKEGKRIRQSEYGGGLSRISVNSDDLISP